jgi:hypothetical protein
VGTGKRLMAGVVMARRAPDRNGMTGVKVPQARLFRQPCGPYNAGTFR